LNYRCCCSEDGT